MEIKVKPGTYVVAVSGGVDSMVLLDLLVKQGLRAKSEGRSSKKPQPSVLSSSPLKLIVAHFDHGIRPDSNLDRELVQSTAEKYGLPFVFDEGQLGPKASEAVAREARYKFLDKTVKATGAQAIITAHHQDDLLETAIINLLRGTNRRGLASLKDLPELQRPLLQFTKAEIIVYAKKNKLQWREDSTNQDTAYLRNYIRLKLLPKFSDEQKAQLLSHINQVGQLNQEIEDIVNMLTIDQTELDRNWFISLDHQVARDIMASWLRKQGVTEIDSKRLEILVRAAKTFSIGKSADIDKTHKLTVEKDKLALNTLER